MTGERLARILGANRALNVFGPSDGRAAVVAGYAVGPGAVLAADPMQRRPPGSPFWWVKVGPSLPGDGPSYLIPADVAARFLPFSVPRVPDADALADESERYGKERARVSAELDASDLDYWVRGYTDDTVSSVREAPGVLGSWVGGTIRGVTTVLGGAAGAFYGSLPLWAQVLIPVVALGASAYGAARVVGAARVALGDALGPRG